MIARPAGLRAAESVARTTHRALFNANAERRTARLASKLVKPQKQKRVLASYYRGGTSRGLIFDTRDLPSQRKDWAALFRGALGSPDPNGRQLDGLGGGISSLSKICVVGPSEGNGADVEFTFVQVGIKDGGIDYSGNCGNLMACIGPYAVDAGVIDVSEDQENATVRIFNTNTGKIIEASFPVFEGEAATASGDFAIDGVPGTGAKIKLDFLDPAGSKTAGMFPTGNMVDEFDGVNVTCVDVGNPSIFMRAEELGVEGTILPDQWDKTLLRRLEDIRVQAAVKMGMGPVTKVPPSIPKVCIVSPSSSHTLLSGERLEANDVDIVIRCISVGQPHKALPITAGLATGAAAQVEGTVVQEVISMSKAASSPHTTRPTDVEEGDVVIGHASGKLDVGARFVDASGGRKELERVTVFRTARRLMDGVVFWK